MKLTTREVLEQAAEASERLGELLYAAGVNERLDNPRTARLLAMNTHAEACARALTKISKVRTLGVSNV